jgi:hypothetical protein
MSLHTAPGHANAAPASLGSPTTRAVAGLAAVPGVVAGAVLGAAFGAAALVRRTKPLHPIGQVGTGVLDVTDPRPGLGVPLLAEERSHTCLVRWSRAAGLPEPLPDVEGFAIRFDAPTADMLFASTGTGAVSRFLLVPRAAGHHGPQTTLLPVASEAGPLMFRLTPETDTGEPPSRLSLAVATGTRSWDAVGSLSCVWGPDRPIRFDPVEHVLPGTEQYPVVRVLREPAYFMARRGAAART